MKKFFKNSEREKERAKKKLALKKKLETQYIEEEKKWEKHEEEREKERNRSKIAEEDMLKRKKRLIERDLNYDSEDEKRQIEKLRED